MTAPRQGYAMRRLRCDEVPMLVEWAAAEGWNPGTRDAEAFHAADPAGFWVGEWRGEPVAGLSLVAYADRYAFLGLYIVRPAHRGQGFGLALWRHALGELGDRVCGLDGVPARVADYRRSGFRDAYRQVRFRAEGRAGPVDDGIAAAGPADWPALLDYDTRVFGVPRGAFLRAWLGMDNARVAVSRRAGRVTGYAVLRRCADGSKIGPLFADDARDADRLFLACCGMAGGGAVYLDVPEANGEAVALARRHALQPVFETLRMYRNGQPDFPVARVYGVTSFELG